MKTCKYSQVKEPCNNEDCHKCLMDRAIKSGYVPNIKVGVINAGK